MTFLFSSARRRSTSRPRSRGRSRRGLWALEGLEDRVLLSGPTNLAVTDTSDNASDVGSLRYSRRSAASWARTVRAHLCPATESQPGAWIAERARCKLWVRVHFCQSSPSRCRP
jgi:hypothetical protein